MNRTIGGIPVLYWIAGLGIGIGLFAYIKKRGTANASPGTALKTNQNQFTQAQEVQDFQIFSALTGAQQASDLNFLSEVAGLFSGGSSTAATGSGSGAGGGGGGGGSTIPSPTNNGATNPSFVPLSAAQAHNLQLTNPGTKDVYYQSAPGIFTQIPVTAFNPTSSYGPAFLEAPSGYSAPSGTSPVSGVVGG